MLSTLPYVFFSPQNTVMDFNPHNTMYMYMYFYVNPFYLLHYYGNYGTGSGLVKMIVLHNNN